MPDSYEILKPKNRREWLERRRKTIGGSDAAAILGKNRYKSPFAVWSEKVGLLEIDEDEPSEAAEWGHILERPIADAYAKRTGRLVSDPGDFTLYRSTELPAHATPDRIFQTPEEIEGPLSIKLTSLSHQWEVEPPVEAQIQLQHEMMVVGWDRGSIAVLIRGIELRWMDISINEKFVDFLRRKIEEFWGFVEREEPPAADASRSTREALQRIFPREKPESVIKLPVLFDDLSDEYDGVTREIDRLFKHKDMIQNQVRAAMGAASKAVVPNSGAWTWRVETRKGYTVKERTTRVLRRSEPKGE